MRRIRYMIFGTDECADPRLCYEIRRAVLDVVGRMAEIGLAIIDGKSRRRVSFTDVPLAIAVLGCGDGGRPE
jgi:hypothetical protein